MQSISFGGKQYECLEVAVVSYERDATGDYHDDNWLNVNVSATFQAAELLVLYEGLSQLYEKLSGKIEFETLEEQLRLEFVGNGRGSIEVHGEAMDQPGIGNKLSFTFHLDQSQLKQSMQALKAAIAAYPVRS